MFAPTLLPALEDQGSVHDELNDELAQRAAEFGLDFESELKCRYCGEGSGSSQYDMCVLCFREKWA